MDQCRQSSPLFLLAGSCSSSLSPLTSICILQCQHKGVCCACPGGKRGPITCSSLKSIPNAAKLWSNPDYCPSAHPAPVVLLHCVYVYLLGNAGSCCASALYSVFIYHTVVMGLAVPQYSTVYLLHDYIVSTVEKRHISIKFNQGRLRWDF